MAGKADGAHKKIQVVARIFDPAIGHSSGRPRHGRHSATSVLTSLEWLVNQHFLQSVHNSPTKLYPGYTQFSTPQFFSQPMVNSWAKYPFSSPFLAMRFLSLHAIYYSVPSDGWVMSSGFVGEVLACWLAF